MTPGAGAVAVSTRELAFVFEIGLLVASFFVLRSHLEAKARRSVGILTGVLVLVQTLSTFVLPVPGSVIELAITSQLSYVAFAFAAWWAADR